MNFAAVAGVCFFDIEVIRAREANVERKHVVHARERLLRVEIGGIGNHPPATPIRVDVPDVVLPAEDSLGCNLFEMEDALVTRLRLHVFPNVSHLVFGVGA